MFDKVAIVTGGSCGIGDTAPEPQAGRQQRRADTPAADRIATTDDIAQIVAFLASESSRWSTGSVVNANGGVVYS